MQRLWAKQKMSSLIPSIDLHLKNCNCLVPLRFANNFQKKKSALFTNQVAGHHPLLRFNGKVLKPLLARELSFYKWVGGKSLHKFTAGFHGVSRLKLGKEKVTEMINYVENQDTNPWSSIIVKNYNFEGKVVNEQYQGN